MVGLGSHAEACRVESCLVGVWHGSLERYINDMKLKFVKNPSGVRLGVKEVSKIAAALIRIEKEKGIITPKIVVQSARSESSPLHKYITWDDQIAAERYREVEAGRLIRSVYVVDTEKGDDAVPVRAFVNIKDGIEEGDETVSLQGYVSMKTTLVRPDFKSQVLNYASEQLRLWRNRFGNLKEFFEVTEAIDRVIK